MSPALDALLQKQDLTLKAQERCQKLRESLESYLSTLNVEHINTSQLGKIVDDYDTTAGKLDLRGLELEKQLQDIEEEVEEERVKLTESNLNEKLNLRVAIGLFVSSEGEVEIALIYGTMTWSTSIKYP